MSVAYKDYYKILGVSRTATPEEIQKAYKKLARKFHPDLNKDNKDAEERFKEVNEANEVLKDAEKRKLYDQLGPNYQHGQQFQNPHGFQGGRGYAGADFGGSGFSDFFETLFGGGFGGQGFSFNQGGPQFGGNFGGFNQAPAKGRDTESSLTLSLEEAVAGGKKSISLRGQEGARSLEVNIPAGIKNGARIRLNGQGEKGPAGPGDLYLRITIAKHPDFTLDDADIIYDLQLAPWDAVLGCKARIPTPAGAVELTIPAGTSSGKKLRLRGRGLGSGAGKGDLLVHVHVQAPDSLTERQKELWEELKALG